MREIAGKTENLAQQQIELLPIGICVIDLDLNVLTWNKTLTDWTQISAEMAIGANLAEYYSHLKSTRFVHRIKDVFESGQPAVFAPSATNPFIPIRLGAGDQMMLQKVIIAPLGTPSHYAQISLVDVTSQYRQIQSLRKEKEEHRLSRSRTLAILETAADAIITITAEGMIESFNSAAEKLFGYSEAEVLEKNVSILMPSPFREAHDGYLARYLETGENHIIGVGREVVGKRKDGTTLAMWLSVSEVAMKAAGISNSPRLFTGMLRDLTRQKEVEKELVQARQAAEAADRSKSEFLANMSHEIRTPMTAILGFVDILLSNVVEPENIDAAYTIKRNGEYLIELINDILDLSKIEAGKIDVEQIDSSPHEIIADVISLMKVRATAKGLPLEVRFEGPIPETIQSDPTRLRQILINLVGNAIKFTETGSIQIVTRLLNDPSKKPHLQFDVIDSGIGIAKEKIAKLFLPFTQADGSTTRQFGGTGLGLTISKRLAELLHGKISVSSTPGKGSTFSVTVATGALDHVRLTAEVAEVVAKKREPKTVDQTEVSLRGRRILLAEDGLDNQRLIGFILKKAGAEVALADNGKIAFDFALAAMKENRPFDVILMDMQMPVMDGYAATRNLRTSEYSGPILALTAHAMDSDRQKCLDAGCDDYSTKPIDRAKLLTIVAHYAEQQSFLEDLSVYS